MILNEQTVETFKSLLMTPEKHGLDIPKLEDCFLVSEKPTAKHLLYEQYIEKVQKNVPKVIFYIIMDEKYSVGKSEDGNLGYFLIIKP